MLKRAFDLAAAVLGMVVLGPVLALIALLVRLDSPGPALFRQVRVGRGGVDFILFKFRTMTVREGSERGRFDAGDTSRVTRIGRFLREKQEYDRDVSRDQNSYQFFMTSLPL